MEDNQITDYAICVLQINDFLKSTCEKNTYANLYHFIAMSCVIRKPIQSFYPHSFLDNTYNRVVRGRGVSTKAGVVVTLMWTQMVVPRHSKDFHPNHLVPLLDRSAQSAIDVSLASTQSFPSFPGSPSGSDSHQSATKAASPSPSSNSSLIFRDNASVAGTSCHAVEEPAVFQTDDQSTLPSINISHMSAEVSILTSTRLDHYNGIPVDASCNCATTGKFELFLRLS